VRALPTGTALAAVGPGIPTILAIGTTTLTLTWQKSAEEILDQLAGSWRSLNTGQLPSPQSSTTPSSGE